MVVRLDQPGQDGHLREIDHPRRCRDRQIRSDISNPRPLDEDDLIRQDAAGVGIEEASSADRGHWSRRLLRRGAGSETCAHQEQERQSSHVILAELLDGQLLIAD